MTRVQGGDPQAFELLVERYRSRLFAFLCRRTDPGRSDDLFQDTWLRVARARGSFDPTRRFSTWLFSIANNLCRDAGRRGAVELRERAAAQHAGEPSVSTASVMDARLDVGRRLALLPERLREVLVLRYFEDLGEREIAEIVGVPPGTVKSRLHAAVRALRGQSEVADDG
jgi:RNA polymerase sigma-70 factor (ECF subfamily)